jgi:methylthioribose-1-phosphate isomerase
LSYLAITALMGLAEDLKTATVKTGEMKNYILETLDYIGTSRPTAVTLFNAITQVKDRLLKVTSDIECLEIVNQEAEFLLKQDEEDNKKISQFGFEYVTKSKTGKMNILTHCNTGALATSRFGTALGIIRRVSKDFDLHVYATETRPYNQGARLTAFELVYEKIPVTLIVDSSVSFLLKTKHVDAIIVGADRICKNGDTANKIGTYQLAITAKYHGIPFLVAASYNAIDLNLEDGDKIEIEERTPNEILYQGSQRVVVEGVNVWNPSFDITPGSLITAIVTEKGVFEKKNGVFNLKL